MPQSKNTRRQHRQTIAVKVVAIALCAIAAGYIQNPILSTCVQGAIAEVASAPVLEYLHKRIRQIQVRQEQ